VVAASVKTNAMLRIGAPFSLKYIGKALVRSLRQIPLEIRQVPQPRTGCLVLRQTSQADRRNRHFVDLDRFFFGVNRAAGLKK
ncbi:MAG: hypothetical protein ACRD5L_04355, partial [Bryobacteraceae bacterium]